MSKILLALFVTSTVFLAGVGSDLPTKEVVAPSQPVVRQRYYYRYDGRYYDHLPAYAQWAMHDPRLLCKLGWRPVYDPYRPYDGQVWPLYSSTP